MRFEVDGHTAFETTVTPYGPLGFVLWIDNQYAALPPDGKLGFGSLENPEATWIEVRGMNLDNIDMEG